jgi:SpoVK/Ycf46/Vps4 family AAA+-type ATPase
MARADLLLELIRAALDGNETKVRSVVEALAAEERQKKHGILADQLSRLLDRPAQRTFVASTDDARPSTDGVLEVDPKLRLHDLLLPEVVLKELSTVVEEQHRAELLRAYNLEPRNRVLLVGPPGNGKTSCAEALATELAVPLFVLRYESVITSFLGETSSKLNSVLANVRQRHCVLFIDEFDTLAKERGDEHDTGEIKRIVSTLLLQIDRLPSHVVICAATNHSELLDRAVWRRFQVRLEIPAPSVKDRYRFALTLSDRLSLRLDDAIERIVDKLGPASYSELEEFFLELRRRQILAVADASSDQSILKETLSAYQSRAGRPLRRGQSTD